MFRACKSHIEIIPDDAQCFCEDWTRSINRPSGERQTMRYNTVRATSMHSAFVILDQCRYQGLEISEEDFDNFVTLINSVEQDEKQRNNEDVEFPYQCDIQID